MLKHDVTLQEHIIMFHATDFHSPYVPNTYSQRILQQHLFEINWRTCTWTNMAATLLPKLFEWYNKYIFNNLLHVFFQHFLKKDGCVSNPLCFGGVLRYDTSNFYASKQIWQLSGLVCSIQRILNKSILLLHTESLPLLLVSFEIAKKVRGSTCHKLYNRYDYYFKGNKI